VALLVVTLLLPGCANIVPPEGGKKDETAPVLLSITPADSSLNIRPSKIVLRFDEYVEVRDLEKNLSLSPLLSIPPTVMSYGKRVEIKLQDTLQENTTYRIGLGKSLVDNHEGNPYQDLNYLFSTGSYFDSLQLQGRVIDAATGLPDTSALVILYPATADDTAVMRRRPQYAVRASASGHFSFSTLPAKPFRIYAIQDANNNYLYDKGEEKVGFINRTAMPSANGDSLYSFYMFKEVIAAEQSSDTAQQSAVSLDKPVLGNGKANNEKGKASYYVNVDTGNRDLRSFELTRPLTIDLFTPIKSLDTAKVYLSYENNGIEVEAVQKLRLDSSVISISTQWQSDKVYTLRLVKGWARDTSGAELPPGKYFFRTKREEDYGKLTVHVNSRYFGDNFVLYVYKGADSVYKKPVTDSVVILGLLQPGDYSMRIIADDNKNGQWDTGDLLGKKQPEMVFPYSTVMIIKAGWENEVDFVPAAAQELKGKGGKPKIGNPSGSSGNNQGTKEKE
jgi:hypothetical protein